jgi:Kef-type K+ transport system membrane component KefB/mannitol/fructose-specific phosphotransferase system IIA component (Ntr-type)
MEFQLISLLFVLLLAWTAGVVANRMGFPAILGELAAGIIFGPALLGSVVITEFLPGMEPFRLGFQQEVPGLDVLAEIGVFLLMLYIGMEVDFRELIKAGWSGMSAAFGGFFAPFVIVGEIAYLMGFPIQECFFFGLGVAVTSVAVQSRLLFDLRLIGTRMANVMMTGALVSDVLALLGFAILLGVAGEGGVDVGHIAKLTLQVGLFFGLAIAIGLRVLPWLGDVLGKVSSKKRTGNFTLVLLIGLVYAELAHLLGLHAVVGAFMAGMFLREGVLKRKLSHEITTLVHDLSIGFLTPIFFVTAGFHVSLGIVADRPWFVFAAVLAAFFGKAIGAAIFYVATKNPWREGLVIGLGLNGRGGVDIIIAGIALQKGFLSSDLYSVAVIVAFASTLSTPLVLNTGTRWLRRRGELVRADDNRKGVVIIGAMPLARYLAKTIEEKGDTVTLVESNTDRCAAAEREGLTVIRGNALNEEILEIAGARNARMFIAMTPNSEVNTLSSNLAREVHAVPEISTINAQLEVTHATTSSDELESPDVDIDEDAFAHVFNDGIILEEWNKRILRKDVELTTREIKEDITLSEWLGHFTVKNRPLIMLVEQGGKPHLPGAITYLREGDKLVILRPRDKEDLISARLDELIEKAPIIDIPQRENIAEFFNQVAGIMAPRLHFDSPELKAMLLKREEESSTVIVPGIAIPHVLLPGEKIFDLLIARCRDGIDFLEDGAEARTVFVLFGTRDERNMHLRALSAIAQIVQSPQFEERWLEAEEPETLRKLLLAAERKR